MLKKVGQNLEIQQKSQGKNMATKQKATGSKGLTSDIISEKAKIHKTNQRKPIIIF